MAADKSQKQNEVVAEARNEGKTVHFASLMDLSSRTLRLHCEGWIRIIRSIY